jgi:hydroxymethylpyrimidine pyrophosphatase-like HAD family hydrolase
MIGLSSLDLQKQKRLPSPHEAPDISEATSLRRGMTHLKVIATDFDGTIAEHDHVAQATWDALYQAKRAGFVPILVTGRRLDDFLLKEPLLDLFEAIVAEDGAALYFPKRDAVLLPFGHLSPGFIRLLKARGVPLEEGVAIVSTHIPHDETILQALHEVGGGATVEYNRGAVMVEPPGATKGTGLLFALRELGYSPHNVVAIGDAENDRSLFEMAEVAVAVANAQPDIQALCDIVLPEPNGKGVRGLVRSLLNAKLPARRIRPERGLFLGDDCDGFPVHLDPFRLVEENLAIVGGSSSGKSWLAGLLAEELLKQEYQICVIDPEGDYRGLRAFPHTLLLGGEYGPLPSVVDLLNFSDRSRISMVLDLSLYTPEARLAYVTEILHGLRHLRARRGRPQWILIDEIQNLCPTDNSGLTQFVADMLHEQGGMSLVTYRPSLVAPRLLASIDHWLLKRLQHPGDVEAVLGQLPDRYREDSLPARLQQLQTRQVYLCDELCPDDVHSRVITLRSEARRTMHRRHLYKYLHAPLPQAKQFYFNDEQGRFLGYAAGNLWEFSEGIKRVVPESLATHLARGDFERWVREVLRDTELADQIRKLARRQLDPDTLRDVFSGIVIHRYEELEGIA